MFLTFLVPRPVLLWTVRQELAGSSTGVPGRALIAGNEDGRREVIHDRPEKALELFGTSLDEPLVRSAETEAGECKAFPPCVVDDPGIPTSRVSQNPLTPKGLANRWGAVNGSDVTTVPLHVILGCSVLTTFGRRTGDGGSSISRSPRPEPCRAPDTWFAGHPRQLTLGCLKLEMEGIRTANGSSQQGERTGVQRSDVPVQGGQRQKPDRPFRETGDLRTRGCSGFYLLYPQRQGQAYRRIEPRQRSCHRHTRSG